MAATARFDSNTTAPPSLSPLSLYRQPPRGHTMARLFFLSFLAFTAASFGAASPVEQEAMQVVSDKWSWNDCGAYIVLQILGQSLNHRGRPSLGAPSDPVHIKSISISPDPPKPGADLTVTVVGEAVERIEVSCIMGSSLHLSVLSCVPRMVPTPMSRSVLV